MAESTKPSSSDKWNCADAEKVITWLNVTNLASDPNGKRSHANVDIFISILSLVLTESLVICSSSTVAHKPEGAAVAKPDLSE